MQLALVGWSIALVMTVAGLVCALRQRAVVAAILIVTGLALGILSASRLD
ncbi:hypothetical protein [Kribbella shirazensis]|uniref:Uncharacterized protein n=1 Tax=Kribbella shirazensis TaxID=1105143 RepID=A0A7X5ZZA7_9ACTN|nr:hypothetical protein [Kribbella shirazensis]NIK55743.1 hypothetical protein [Kribbella shirazensis]